MMDLFEKNIFRVGGLLLLTFHATAHSASLNPANPWGIRMDIGYTYDDNVSRSSESKLSDNIFSLNLSKGAVVPVSEHTRLLFNGLLGAEKFGTHTGLGRAFAGIHGELMYRASGEFSTPTWAIFGRAFADEYQSALRDGYRFSGGVSARKPVTDRVTLIGALARNVRKAESSVFDTKDTALRMNLDYAVTSSGTLYASGEHRRGDIVFSMKSDVTGVGDTHQLDDALTGVLVYLTLLQCILDPARPHRAHNTLVTAYREKLH